MKKKRSKSSKATKCATRRPRYDALFYIHSGMRSHKDTHIANYPSARMLQALFREGLIIRNGSNITGALRDNIKLTELGRSVMESAAHQRRPFRANRSHIKRLNGLKEKPHP